MPRHFPRRHRSFSWCVEYDHTDMERKPKGGQIDARINRSDSGYLGPYLPDWSDHPLVTGC